MSKTRIEAWIGTVMSADNRADRSAVHVYALKHDHRSPHILLELTEDTPPYMYLTEIILKMEPETAAEISMLLQALLQRLDSDTLLPEDDYYYGIPENERIEPAE